jgi:hypothetical protein
VKYRGTSVSPKTALFGIKRLKDGRYVPFIKSPDGLIFSGVPRATRELAFADIDFVQEILGPGRVYT